MELDLGNKLTPINWESELRSKSPFTARGGWSKSLEKDGLIINLSKVGWVEPIAVLRVALFVEAALVNRLAITVRLPLPDATHAEQHIFDLASASKDPALLEKAKNTGLNIRRRRAASQALRDLRFKEALQDDHLQGSPGALTIVDKYDWSSIDEAAQLLESTSDREEENIAEDHSLPWGFEVVYGLQWIPDPRSKEGRDIIDHLA